MSSCIRLAPIPFAQVAEIFAALSGMPSSIKHLVGWPQDAQIVDAFVEGNHLVLKVQSATFAEVQVGYPIPVLGLAIEEAPLAPKTLLGRLTTPRREPTSRMVTNSQVVYQPSSPTMLDWMIFNEVVNSGHQGTAVNQYAWQPRLPSPAAQAEPLPGWTNANVQPEVAPQPREIEILPEPREVAPAAAPEPAVCSSPSRSESSDPGWSSSSYDSGSSSSSDSSSSYDSGSSSSDSGSSGGGDW